jgi:hypothetical protein
MMIQIAHDHNVARMVDGVDDNPNELSIGRTADGRVAVGIVDRDSGSAELWINVCEEDLLAALAVTRSGSWAQ